MIFQNYNASSGADNTVWKNAMNDTETNHPFYVYIGQRLRERRKLLKMSQMQLASMMGFSYQQIQKYETGASQVPLNRLLQFARIMNVPLAYFYEGARLDNEMGASVPSDIIQRVRTTPLRVLLVEDSPADIILFRKALMACSELVDLHVVHDGENAMFYVQNHRHKFGKDAPDLVMLDLSLPKISGLQVLKSMKNNQETAAIPVVILTNSISSKDMLEAYRNGVAGFIQKSLAIEEYMDAIETTMRYWSRTVVLPMA